MPREYKIAGLIAFCLTAFRSWGRIWYPDLWAEDGSVYLTEALQFGTRSIFWPAFGSFHVAQRLIALSAVYWVPIKFWPHYFYVWPALIFVATVSLFGLKRYAWLVASDRHRYFTVALLCFTPGMNELFGNLANLNWVLILLLALLILQDPEFAVSGWTIATALLVIFSTGTSLLLLPLLIWRVVDAFSNHRSARHKLGPVVLVGAVVMATGVLALANLSHQNLLNDTHPLEREKYSDWAEVIRKSPEFYFEAFARSVLYRPWVGSGLATRFRDDSSLIWVGWVVAVVLCGWLLLWAYRHRREPRCAALLMLVLGISFWPVLRILGRPGSINVPVFVGNNYWGFRYSFPSGFTAVLLWMGILTSSQWGWTKRLLVLFLCLNLSHGIDRLFIRPYSFTHPGYPSERLWSKWAPELKRAIDAGTEIKVPIYPHPEDWFVHYK